MNRKISLLSLSLILALLCALMSSCNNMGTLTSISINNESFKQEYAIDEKINYNNTYILLHYSDGKSSRLKVKSDMISGFDTSTTGFEKVLSVTYKGFTVTHIYNVRNSFEILTTLRLNAEVSANKLFLSLSPFENFPHGIYGISFIINNLEATVVTLINASSFKVSFGNKNKSCEIICYSFFGDSFISENRFLEISFEDSIASLSITEITVNDGFNDIHLPNISI